MRSRFYLGYVSVEGRLELFKSEIVPTHETHGEKYAYAIGPFVTKRGALYMQAHGISPFINTVYAAEKAAKREMNGTNSR